eukprot:TRINITY_DN16237_c0_g1_i8.p2 TRINITY_DN16237_c0_g1~~TRINITY_DN16237_c0_g1_i8.p2  ORF type:complete len:206 (-),score=43.29 TRINITY_DN16237_c0_g1_i8:382-999(-)
MEPVTRVMVESHSKIDLQIAEAERRGAQIREQMAETERQMQTHQKNLQEAEEIVAETSSTLVEVLKTGFLRFPAAFEEFREGYAPRAAPDLDGPSGSEGVECEGRQGPERAEQAYHQIARMGKEARRAQARLFEIRANCAMDFEESSWQERCESLEGYTEALGREGIHAARRKIASLDCARFLLQEGAVTVVRDGSRTTFKRTPL